MARDRRGPAVHSAGDADQLTELLESIGERYECECGEVVTPRTLDAHRAVHRGRGDGPPQFTVVER